MFLNLFKKGSLMNRLGFVIAVFGAAIIVVSCLVSCDVSMTNNAGEKQSSDSPSQALTTEFYAGRPTQYTWPIVESSLQQGAGVLLAKNYYLVIDGSGSMDDSGCSGNLRKIDAAKEAVVKFVTAIPADANVGLLVFDEQGIGERVPLGENHALVKQHIHSIVASGGTPLLTAMSAAYRAIGLQAQKQFGYGEYHMVVVTDGEANNGEDPSGIVSKILQESPVTIHTIGFCIGSGHSLNLPGITSYYTANNPEELLVGLQNVLAESTEYAANNFEEAESTQ
jgi:Ca-activated chloride channel homolog